MGRLFVAVWALCIFSMANAADEFCWKDSYGRGVGTIPTQCSGGKTNQAGLCYDNCKAGYTAVGPVCWSACPAGYVDHGAICHIDKPLTVNPEWVCTAWFPKWMGGECRWKDTRCPSGYTNAGLFCALTSAGKGPPAGFSGTYLDPMKNSYGRGAGTIPTGCGNDQNDAGLCYTRCRAGYDGVGPVCWGGPPSGWVQCGMGAAKSSNVCASIVFGQVASVGQMAITVASLGSSTALTAGMKAPEDASKLTKLKQQYSSMKTAFDLAKKNNANVKAAVAAADAANKGKKGYVAMETADNLVTEEDMVRLAAQITSILDPTGVSDTVAAYTYPKCSKMFK
jgi:hypothetical protein